MLETGTFQVLVRGFSQVDFWRYEWLPSMGLVCVLSVVDICAPVGACTCVRSEVNARCLPKLPFPPFYFITF